MALILSDDDVTSVLTMEECVSELELAYRDIALGTAANIPRQGIFMASTRPDAYYSFKTINGGLERLGVVAQRITSDLLAHPLIDEAPRHVKIPAAPGNRYVGLVFLYSCETLELLAIITDRHLERMRVAGTTAVAAKYLARSDSRVAALLGSGWQAEAAAWALAVVRPLSTIRIFSPNEVNRTDLARRLRERLDIQVMPVASPQAAVKDADIVACASNSLRPVMEGGWIQEGQHVTTVHVNELADDAYSRADLVIHSCPPGFFSSTSTDNPALETTRPEDEQRDVESRRWELFAHKSHTLADLLVGRAPGRSAAHQVTLCSKSWGLGIEFASVGKLAYDRARAQGLGKEIPTEWFTQGPHS